VVQAAGHLGADLTLLAQAAQLLPLGLEQLGDHLGVAVACLAGVALAVQVRQAGPVALAEAVQQLRRQPPAVGVDRVQPGEGDLGQPRQRLGAGGGLPLVGLGHPQAADHPRQGEALAHQSDHDHREGQEHHQVAFGERPAAGDLGGDGQRQRQRHHPAHPGPADHRGRAPAGEGSRSRSRADSRRGSQPAGYTQASRTAITTGFSASAAPASSARERPWIPSSMVRSTRLPAKATASPTSVPPTAATTSSTPACPAEKLPETAAATAMR
jgi:hypothetical protein